MPPTMDLSRQYQIISETYGIPLLVLDPHGMPQASYSLLSQSALLLFNFSDFKSRFLALWQQDHTTRIVSNELNQVWAGVALPAGSRSGHLVVIGPVFLSDTSKNLVVEYAYSYDIADRQRDQWLSALNQTQACSYIEFARLVAVVHGLTCGEFLDAPALKLVRLSSREVLPFNELTWEERISAQKGGAFNPSALFEHNLLDSIRQGNLGKLKRLLMTSNYADMPQYLSTTHIRAHKNNFIGLLFLVTRMAAEGGLNWAMAYSLNEQYAQQVESLRDVQSILNLTREMLYDFTARVGSLKRTTDHTRRVNDCCNYIHEHVDGNLTVADIAAFSGFSANTIARKFKAETGLSIREYIRQAKIDEAKTLLRYSSLSLAEISQQLSFSSQSYFTATFRRVTGLTPLQYRETADQ
ncbi:MAG: AraC family transcriptional regulator [Anaerolineae bacterium]|nr:AraC family transcriptional regulator [Anaerolineae bacterium]